MVWSSPYNAGAQVSDRITMDDVMKAHGCAWGALRMGKRHGLDCHKFFKGGGLPISEVEHIDDALLKKVIEVARERQ